MAKKQITLIVDDLTGEEAADASTITFSLDGATYEIDLSPANADKLTAALQPYVAAGRKVGGRARSARSSSSPEAASIRAWAVAKGLEVPARGRIPQTIVEQYRAAR